MNPFPNEPPITLGEIILAVIVVLVLSVIAGVHP